MPEYSIKDIMDQMSLEALPEFPDEPKLAELKPDEIKAIHYRLLQVAENEEVFHALWEARNKIYEAVRMVKKRTNTDFKGFNAEGSDLDLHLVGAQDVMSNGTALTVFEKSVTAGTAYYWSDTGNSKVEVDEDEALVIVGWYDPVDSPKATKLMIELPKRRMIVDLPFRFNKDVPLIIHEPVIVGPKEKFRVQVRYDSDGTDALMPVAVKISKAENFEL